MTHTVKFAFIPVVLLAAALLAAGQTPEAPLPSDPHMVYLPVAVTGPKNSYIGGLKKENFQLREDNIPQTVSYFSGANQPFDMDIILAVSTLQRGRSDLNSQKIRDAVETFRQNSNHSNRVVVEEMPFGSNGVFDAISRHVARLADLPNPRKALIVLTDGFDSAGGDPGRALQEYAKKKDVPIYLFFTAPHGQGANPTLEDVVRGHEIHLEGGAIFEDLTRYTGGRMVQAEADTQLRPAMESLAIELKNQYILGFKSTNDARNDKWRKLEVKVQPPEGMKDLKVRVRDRYFVAKAER
jgi:Ca-activated chloride channel family protein